MASGSSGPGRASDAVAVFAGAAMRGPLQQMLADRGLRLREWAHLRSHHRPGGAVSALYRVRCGTGNAGSKTGPDDLTLHIGVTTAAVTAMDTAPGLTRARIAGLDLRMWLHPHDPVLASLPWAVDAGAVGQDVFGTGSPARLSLVAYRPLRRAVVRAEHAGSTAYLKLLPKPLLPGLRQRHQLLAAAGLPVPPLLPVPPAHAGDAVALGGLAGISLFRLLASSTALPAGTAIPAPETLLQLLDELPAAALELPHRHAWAERAGDYACTAAAVLPAEEGRIRELAAGIQEVLVSAPAGPTVPVHGDFHEGNLLVTGSEVTGLLDVDGLGPGKRADDLACIMGHLSVLAAAHPHLPHLGETLLRYRLVFEELVDPASLAARTAGVVLTLVAGSRPVRGTSRVQQARLRLETARQLLRTAQG
ncbi:phosphotransferase [Arthrobacter sp. zg-Y1143]|uniref:phosphotransferase n=1 Tax=Arthrobacter sp. zg-Y1143 TaxID=3049065 RepID=UPI0024C380F0|nr:phosphotransferase [Arthrobacter sp. zg-Y1143]MDK1327049.1 phosphotransferase [Arthrobacter sp. zg-Y1143]